eukprot:jgi/Tetstr1/458495/TSEL_044901.t1
MVAGSWRVWVLSFDGRPHWPLPSAIYGWLSVDTHCRSSSALKGGDIWGNPGAGALLDTLEGVEAIVAPLMLHLPPAPPASNTGITRATPGHHLCCAACQVQVVERGAGEGSRSGVDVEMPLPRNWHLDPTTSTARRPTPPLLPIATATALQPTNTTAHPPSVATALCPPPPPGGGGADGGWAGGVAEGAQQVCHCALQLLGAGVGVAGGG